MSSADTAVLSSGSVRKVGFIALTFAYLLLVIACLGTLVAENEISMGRNPIENLIKTGRDFIRPSFVDVWFGNPRLEYRSDDGQLLRVENRQEVESRHLEAMARATWTTIRIATLGSLLAALLALPLAILSARNLGAPKLLSWAANSLLDISRSIHTLVFGLIIVGIIGLGPTAGIFAIALHSMGTYGKLFAESIEALDMGAIDAVRSVGATPAQVFSHAVLPAVAPQFVSSHLYVWEFNIRDSTILGIIGAGGLGQIGYQYGYIGYNATVMNTVLVLLVILVYLIQLSGDRIVKAVTHK